MQEVTVTRHVDAPPADVEDAIDDVEWFMRAAEFTDVTVEGDVVTVENRVGFATLTLEVELVEDDEAALAFGQREGIFAEMETRYLVAADDGGSEVTAVTEFALGKGVVGSALDATLVSRQRRSELTAQLDALADRFGGGGD